MQPDLALGLIAEPTLPSRACSPLATAGTWNILDAVIMKSVSLAGTTVDPCCLVGVIVTAPTRDLSSLEPLGVPDFPSRQTRAAVPGPGTLPCAVRTFKGAISELRVVLYLL